VEIFKEQQAIADTPKVAKATNKANNGTSPTDPDLEAKIAELYH
jgi:hypothetical protein